MIVAGKKPLEPLVDENGIEKQQWDNPAAPEEATDKRDVEQLQRQIEEADRIKENLTEDTNETK